MKIRYLFTIIAKNALTAPNIPLGQRFLLLIAIPAVLIDIACIVISARRWNPDIFDKELNLWIKLGWVKN